MSSKLIAIMKLTRIEHSLMLVIAVIAAELIALGALPSPYMIILSIIPPVLVSMGAFAINDYFDVEIDRQNNKHDRPLVSGLISKKTAMRITIITFVIGVAISIFINLIAFAIVAIFAFLAYLYSHKLKHIPLVGNLYIAFTMVIPFLYGNYVVSYSLSYTIILISFVVFLSGLAREMHGMIRDYGGDIKAGKLKNVVYRIGIRRAAQLSFILYIEAITISIFMFFFSAPFKFNAIYAVIIAVTDIALAYVAVGYLLGKKSGKFFKLSRNLSLGAMALALIAYLAAALVFVPF